MRPIRSHAQFSCICLFCCGWLIIRSDLALGDSPSRTVASGHRVEEEDVRHILCGRLRLAAAQLCARWYLLRSLFVSAPGALLVRRHEGVSAVRRRHGRDGRHVRLRDCHFAPSSPAPCLLARAERCFRRPLPLRAGKFSLGHLLPFLLLCDRTRAFPAVRWTCLLRTSR